MRQLLISFAIAEKHAGSLLADLADRVQNLSFKVVEEMDAQKNTPRGSKWSVYMVGLAKLPTTFTSKDLIRAIPSDTPKSSMYSFLASRVNAGELKKLTAGKYRKL